MNLERLDVGLPVEHDEHDVASNELYKFRQYCKALGKEASQLTNNELESYYLNNV